MKAIPIANLEQVAALAPPPQPPASASNGIQRRTGFSIDKWIVKHGLKCKDSVPYQGGRKWSLEACAFNPEHKAPDAALFESEDGRLGYKCLHNSCSGKDWHAFRALLEGAPALRLRRGQDEPERGESASQETTGGPNWPGRLAAEACHGIVGEWLRLIEPHTEADPAALLVQCLVAFGSVVGRGPHFRAEGDRHFTVLYGAIVGQTAKGRKGTSEGRVRHLFEQVDAEWSARRIKTGLSSGEGLTFEVRDAKEGGKDPDAGETDKRLLVIEPELARVLSVSERIGNTLSPTIRQAWDCPTALSPMTKTNRCTATKPHISLIGHITRDELRRMLTDTAVANGFANRFLWVCSTRSKCLPEGGLDVELADVAAHFRSAVEYGRQIGEMTRDEVARATWHRVYPSLSEGMPGMLGAVTSRAEAQVMRLACVYALLDHRARIEEAHLLAALAVWDYCFASARYIFGDALGDQVADEILRALRVSSDGMTRNQIREHFGRNKSSAEIGRALAVLAEYGLARSFQQETEGRSAELWRCTR